MDLEEPTETIDVATDGRDVRRWEMTYATSYVTAETTVTQITQLVHLAAVRGGHYSGSWEDFDSRCVAVKRLRPADPTQPPGDIPPADMENTSAG